MPKGDKLPATAMKKVQVEPGQLELFDRFRQMPPCRKSDPAGVEERLNQFFKLCRDYELLPTVESMSLILGVSRVSLWQWEKDTASESGRLINRAKSVINATLVQATMNGKVNPVYSIWLQKNNFGYSDTQTIEVRAAGGADSDISEKIENAGLIWSDELNDFVIDRR